MTTWNPRANELFLKAQELRSTTERRRFLDETCGGDAALRAEVESLLEAGARVGSFLESPIRELVSTVDEPALTEHPGTVIGAYRLLEQIGEGGFGVVFMAQQTRPVRRKVALKVLKPGMDTRQVVARFEAERQALALMDHPHIAHIFDGGETATGRPYFVMELVRGIPITDFCDQNHLSIRPRLQLIIDVCQAVQHAHRKGIIHRDLKPSNVLVTRHDETPVVKVIDFGIAKATGQQLTDKTLFTNFAQLIGTPLYMSPEQVGRNGLDVDTRSDVYSLGVLLYELLTGTTPFDQEHLRSASYDEIRRLICEEEPAWPSTRISTLGQAATTVSMRRQSEPKKLSQLFRGELDWIVMKALEKDRNRRYETANDLARDIQHYLADEPVEACPPSVVYRLRKLARRQRLALAVSGLILLFLLSLGTVIGWTIRDRQTRQSKAATDMEVALERADLFREQGKRAEALAALERAELLADDLPSGSPLQERLWAVKERLDADERDRRFIARFEGIRLREQSGVDVKGNRFTSEAVFPAIRNALYQYGIAIGDLSPAQAAARIQDRPESIRRNLLAALDEYLKQAPEDDSPMRQWLLATLEAADNDAWRVQVRKAMANRDWKALDPLVRGPDIERQPPSFLLSVAKAFPARMTASKLELLRRIQSAYPADLWANHDLAFTLYQNGQSAEAIRYYYAALALRPDNPGIYYNRGLALMQARELDAAIADLRQSVRLAPQYSMAHNGLGNALRDKGRFDEAFAEYRTASLLDPKASWPHVNLGIALYQQKKLDEAVAEYRTAIELDPKYAVAHNNLGLALYEQTKLDEAVAEYRKAIELDPEDVDAHNNLGNALSAKGCVDKAIAVYGMAIELDPNYWQAHYNLGNAFRAKGRLDEAIAEYRKAIQLDPKRAAPHDNLGNAFRAKGRLDEAVAEYRKAIELDPKLAPPHNDLGVALYQRNERGQAVAEWKKAIELDPKYATPHHNLGLVLYQQKKLDGASAEYRKAIELDPRSWQPHYNLGLALYEQKKLDEAIAAYRTTIVLEPKYWQAHNNLGLALCQQKKLDEAIAAYRKAIELDARNVTVHINLGNALRAVGRLDEAIAEYRTAIQVKPDHAGVHDLLAWILATTTEPKRRDGREAVALAQRAVKLEPGNGSYWNTLGAAQYRVGDWRDAIAALEKSIELSKGGNSCDWFFLAMAHWQIGEQEIAREWFNKAVQWMDQNQPGDEELRRFRAEASQLLKSEAKEK